jgi:hypothetical protein
MAFLGWESEVVHHLGLVCDFQPFGYLYYAHRTYKLFSV